ncbi:hypothetical protein TESG_01030 [Trichophyton tonsurans CBS 112818]|uniref:HORMA domain-containing protein n=1 Tax=Trichophyton tonsurans (strain CBS 112818) TaxID=647933 RepID=F2RQA1_TRIT1|nr:hypothetical protein TESG_01030 [Trichophyton tonsurans CBS 112818]
MAQAICTRPARQTAAAVATTTSVASATAQRKAQGQHAANGPVTKTIPKPLSLCQPQSLMQKQSLAFAQIMLHTSFGTLFYLREFLPLSCFGERDLLNLKRPDSNISYGDFVDGCSGSEAEAGKRGQPLKIILRGRNPKADSVLNLLEHGIFDALEKNVLEAVQLTVFVDKENPSHVLETYTFSFNYTEGGVNELKKGLEAVSLETNVPTIEVKTFRTAKQGLEMIIRRLITLSTFLPILPNKRFLEIHLFYTQNCPQQYEPRGFKPTTHDQILYPRDDNWKKETQSCGIMNAGCHRVGLKVTSLKCTHEDTGDEEAETRQIPDTLKYSEKVERDSEVGLVCEEPASQAMTQGSDERSSQESIQVMESTQTRQDAITKGNVQKMLEVPPPDSELTQTQADSYLGSNPSKATSGAQPCLSQAQTSKIKQRINLSQATQIAGDKDPGNEVVQITDLLRKNSFLEPTPGSKRRGFAEKGLPRFRVPDSENIRHRLRNEIFNPLAKISHHYMIPSTQDPRQNGARPVVVPTTAQISSTKSGNMLSSHTNLQPKTAANVQTIPNSEPIVISEDEDDSIAMPCAAPSVAPSKCQRISSMGNGGRAERDNAATTSPPSSPPHSQYSLASRAQEELRRGLRYGGGRTWPLVDADSQIASVNQPAKQQPLKRRKLSNAAHPIDIGDSAAEESG